MTPRRFSAGRFRAPAQGTRSDRAPRAPASHAAVSPSSCRHSRPRHSPEPSRGFEMLQVRILDHGAPARRLLALSPRSLSLFPRGRHSSRRGLPSAACGLPPAPPPARSRRPAPAPSPSSGQRSAGNAGGKRRAAATSEAPQHHPTAPHAPGAGGWPRGRAHLRAAAPR